MVELTLHGFRALGRRMAAVDRNHIKEGLPDDFDILGFFLVDQDYRKSRGGYHPVDSVPGSDVNERNSD